MLVASLDSITLQQCVLTVDDSVTFGHLYSRDGRHLESDCWHGAVNVFAAISRWFSISRAREWLLLSEWSSTLGSNQSDVRKQSVLPKHDDTVEHTCSAIKSVYYKNQNHLGCSIIEVSLARRQILHDSTNNARSLLANYFLYAM